ncbi:hypothetical protein H072_370 [Dactylellina haptotyla CBS 200.50]|uniref:HIT domain-containing protein n=1 Tax=Dactylellina haptotyla (strain CBS 200.50) TaxID=1284197 RepID=S8C1L8_DACHA|nr:hypothetical protein H072_370 [Dactylellina haptotyla CBS 200.50]
MGTPEENIRSFKFERVLNQDTGRKTLNLLGTIDGQYAIITAEKTAFSATSPATLVSPDQGLTALNLLQKNDIYHWFMGTIAQSAADNAAVKVNMIYPCTDVHIKKYSAQQLHMVVETPEIYDKYVLKYIKQKTEGGRLNWVYNILSHKEESEKIIFEDEDPKMGFILLPDLKWDLVTMTTLYLSVIVHRTDIRSIRDFTPAHIPFLNGLRTKVLNAVSEKYSLSRDFLKIYVHYQPSYYHFHIHVVHISHDMGASASVGKAILLDEVIQVLEVMKIAQSASGKELGYKDLDMTYTLGEEHDLWKKVFGPLSSGAEPTI